MTNATPGTPRALVDLELMARADRAEQTGDARGAAEALRALVDRHPDDVPVRLRFARALVAAGHGAAARRALAPLDGARVPPADLEADVHRAFALLDEAEGAPASAADRWERVLADDLDDAEALTHLAALRPAGTPARVGVAETLVSPDGLEALRYRLRRELGRGATAAVYLATDETLGIDVALKVLHPQLAGAGHAEARRRFFAEGRLAASTRHRGVVAIYDLDEGARVLTMEYVAGGTLRARLAAFAGAPVPSAEIEATSVSLLEALAFVHERGILHGDLKPSNLLVRATGDVVLADFGAAQLRGEAAPREEGPAGTPQYLAPEQLRGARAAPATDLYAAGAVLWEMASGRPLRTHAELMRGVMPAPALPTSAAHALGPRVAALVAALVADDPAARPASARAALAALA